MTTPTTNPVPSDSPLDLLFNVEKIDESVSSSALSYLDRFGVTRLTLAGAVARISAVNPRGAWVTATLYNARDVVSNSGTWYIALDQHTSGATFAGDQATHWRVYQGVVSSELADTSSPALGDALVGVKRTLANAAAATLHQWHEKQAIHANAEFGAVGDGVTNDTTALNNAIAAAGSGGVLYLAPGVYKTTAFLNAEGLRGLTIRAAKGQFGWNGARIVGSHTGKAILSLVGSLFCHIEGVTLEGDAATKPKVGLLLGRSSAASAGNHTFVDVHVQGSYQEIGTAIIASEENTWINCYLVPAAARVAGVLISPSDGQTLNGSVVTIGGLTPSSMECNTFIGGAIGNSDNTAGTTGLYIDCNASTGHHHFYSTFFIKNGGDSFVTIRLGAVDGLDTEFPIGFHNCCGEHGAGQPTNGLHIISATTRILAGFVAENLRFQTPATNNILCDGGGSVYMIAPRISTPYRASGSKPSTFNRIDAGDLSLLSESAITITQLTGSRLIHNTGGPSITTSTHNYIQTLGGVVSQRPGVLTGSATYDPPSLADGAGATTTVTVTGAAVGDLVQVSFSNALGGITLTGWVSASDQVSARFQNESGGTVDLASGTLRAMVTKA